MRFRGVRLLLIAVLVLVLLGVIFAWGFAFAPDCRGLVGCGNGWLEFVLFRTLLILLVLLIVAVVLRGAFGPRRWRGYGGPGPWGAGPYGGGGHGGRRGGPYGGPGGPARWCPSCGGRNGPNFQFCRHCGAPLPGTPPGGAAPGNPLP